MFSQASCCSGVARSPEGLKGHIAEWEGIDTYTTSPEGKARAAGIKALLLNFDPNLSSVIVVHDAFGFQLPNTKYQVDYLASKGRVPSTIEFRLFNGLKDSMPCWLIFLIASLGLRAR